MDMQRLLKAQLVVVVMASLAIGLFLLIYTLMGDSTPAATRLFTALLVPPLILVLLGGGYFLFFRKDKTPI
jgi:uncharacterized RDD family membrane protein YckC